MRETNGKGGSKTTFSEMVVRGQPAVDPSSIDWASIGFKPIQTAFMGGSVVGPDGHFEGFEIVASGSLVIPPHAAILNYGQGLFEGLKARRGVDGRIRIFRLADNARRMAKGAARFMLAPVPEPLFAEVVLETVRANVAYVPPLGKGSLYIRPLLMGTGRTLAPGPSPETLFLVYVNPVGHYFKGLECISIQATEKYQRAAERGTGFVKAAGNYAPCFLPVSEAKAEGFAEILFLDHEGKRVEEVGSANFCMIKGRRLFIADAPSILQGITRDSIARIAKESMGLEVVLGELPLDRVVGSGEWKSEGPADEVFCTGTAAIVSPIGSLRYRGSDYRFNGGEVGSLTARLYEELDGIQTGRLPDRWGWTTLVE
ncbi:MAG: branched-chain amino acid aminotransferase [Rectinemataceae bacterium]